MGRVNESLIPARFLATMAQLLAASLVYYSKDDNVRASLASNYTDSEFNDKNSEITAAVTLTVVFVTLQILSIFSGYTLFIPPLNAMHIFLNASGAVLICWFIMDTWNVTTFWYIFIFFSLINTVIEMFYMMQVLWCNSQW
mmetsp:Transcript_22141/g.39238  ORF Transcript_22141/g.39238 Transcript_22141/m.39238 type:complete len:141 (-) Transcript_22141:298-720(-)